MIEVAHFPESSNLDFALYLAQEELLLLAFKPRKSGDKDKIYAYKNFPTNEWDALRQAPSAGKHFANHIRFEFANDCVRVK